MFILVLEGAELCSGPVSGERVLIHGGLYEMVDARSDWRYVPHSIFHSAPSTLVDEVLY